MFHKGKIIITIIFVLLIAYFNNTHLSYANDLVTDVVDISGGAGHTIVLKSDGTVWAWGKNYQGQLGDGSTTDSLKPVQVYGLTNIKEIAAGHNYSLALSEEGTVWAWGINDLINSQILGDGTTTERHRPVEILTGVRHITKTRKHVLVLKNDGTVWTWGKNYWGELGNGTTEEELTPVQVPGLTNVKEIAAGATHSIVLKNDGTVWAWGRNKYGQLGDGTNIDRLTPVQVVGLTNVKNISAGNDHSLALKNDGTVWTWGYNGHGALGYGEYDSKPYHTPKQVSNISNVDQIAAGAWHSMALTSNRTVYTWGCNYNGQLGNGTKTCSASPIKVQNLADIKNIAGGYDHSIALQNDGTVWAWGLNDRGQVGNQQKGIELKPVKTLGLDLPKPVKINVSYIGSLPNKTIQLYVSAIMDDGSIIDVTSDENITYEISDDTLATVNHQGLVLVDPLSDSNDFYIDVFYKDFTAKTETFHVRDSITGDMLIFDDTLFGTYYIFREYKYSHTMSKSLFDAIKNIVLQPLGDTVYYINLLNEIKKVSDITWEDGMWEIRIPVYAHGTTLYLDGMSYSCYKWISIENNNKLTNVIFHSGEQIFYVVTNGDITTLYICDGEYNPK